jgi:acyl-CoA dehydrogenase
MSIFSHRPAIFADADLLLFQDSVRKFLAQHATKADIERWRQQKVVDRDLWYKAAEMGFLGLSIPEEYGGAGADFRFEMALTEALSEIGLESFGVPMHNAVVAPYIVSYGTEAQKRRWLPKMTTGELISGMAMTEPGTGSDLRGIRTTARRDGDEYILNGQKTYISNGQTANLIGVVAKTASEGKSALAIVFLDCEQGDPKGFTRGRNLQKIGLEASDTSELFFDDLRIPAAHLLGETEGVGLRQLMAKLPQERLILAGHAIAAIERALTLTIEFVKQRQAFGQPVIAFQNTQFKLAECKTEAKIARVFVDYCLDLHLRGELDQTTAAMIKYWISDLQCKVIDECLQLHGGAGYMLEYPIAQMYRDARAQRIYGGTNEIMKVLIGRSLTE